MQKKLSINKDTNIICLSDLGDNKKINFNFWGYDLKSTSNQEVLVHYKDGFHTKRFNEISSGMTFFTLVNEKSNIEKILDIKSFLKGVSIVKQFDEQEGKDFVYLYKFPKQNLDDFNQTLLDLGVKSHKAKQLGKFIILDGIIINPPYDIKGLNQIFGFLFGIALVYGNFDIAGNVLNSVKLHIPLIGDVSKSIEFFDELFQATLPAKGIYFKTSQIKKVVGFNYQVVIEDWEVLCSFVNFLKNVFEVEKVSKYDKMLKYKSLVKDFAQKNQSAEFVKKLEDFKFKYYSK